MDDVPSLGVALVMMGDKERGEKKKIIHRQMGNSFRGGVW
jgi:hypothetical protein